MMKLLLLPLPTHRRVRLFVAPSLLLFALLALHTGIAEAQDPCLQWNSSCSDCLDHLTSNDCNYCAYEGALQGSGACFQSWSVSAYACVSPLGQSLTQLGECSKPGDQCQSYSTGCQVCSTAPMQLNCGWCAATKTCEAGNAVAPNSGAYCGADGSGWGLGGYSCVSPQALCDVGGGCGNCVSQPYHCGWCSSTNVCEYGNQTGPINQDCAGGDADWKFGQGSCPVADPCLVMSPQGCSECLATAGCGWCGATSACSSGNSSGPLPSSAQCASEWSATACPSVTGCAQFGSCTDCHSDQYCLWCEDNNECLALNSVCQTSVPYDGSCPSIPSVPSYPMAGVWALVGLSCSALLVLTLASLTKACAPKLGSESLAMMVGAPNARDYSRGFLALLPLLLLLATLGLKISSLALNQWDQSREVIAINDSGDSVSFRSLYGLLSVHTREVDNGAASTTSYQDQCAALNSASEAPGADLSLSNSYHLCETQRAAGLFVVVFAILSVLLSFISEILALRLAVSSSRFATSALGQLRLAGFSAVLTLGALLTWSVSAHVVIHHNDSDAMLGVSWWLMIGAFAVDFALQYFMRKAVRATPPSDPFDAAADASEGASHAYAVLAPGGAYPLVQNQLHATPEGYGRPVNQ